MLKVLLVDDEPVVLQALKVLINWSELDYTVCGEAKDGKTALEIILSQSPDVVITDIRMPALDGLSLIQQSLQKTQRRIRFIILSGYSDFQYAQQAIKFGVAEYLLKPVDEDALAVILKRLQAEIVNENQLNQIKQENAQSALRNKILVLYMSSRKPDGSQIASLKNELHIEDFSRLRCIKLKLSELPEAKSSEAAVDPSEAILKYVEKNYPVFSFDVSKSHISCLYFHKEQSLHQTMAFFSALHDELLRIFSVRIAIIIGMSVGDIGELLTSRDSLLKLETSFYFYEQRDVMLYEDYLNMDGDSPASDMLKADLVAQSIAQHDFEGVNALLDDIFANFKFKHVSTHEVKIFLNNIVLEIIRLINDMEGDYGALIEKNTAYINALDTLSASEAKEMTLRLCLKAINYSEMLIKQNAKGIINDVEKFTMQNYMNEINLKIIADRMHINPAYLGQQFKKKTGKNYNDYLNEIRIEAAKNLLTTSNLKVYEIAEKVGFMNTDYFTSKFQKIEKVSPTEYRMQRVKQ